MGWVTIGRYESRNRKTREIYQAHSETTKGTREREKSEEMEED